MKKEIIIPSSLSQMPLKDYMALMKIVSENSENVELLNKKLVQYYVGGRIKEVDNMPAHEFSLILSHVTGCLNEKPEFQQTFMADGLHFGFIPNFEKDLTTGEYIDLDEYMSDIQMWHRAMAILYRPIIDVKKPSWFRKRFTYKTMKYSQVEEYMSSDKYCEQMLEQPASIMVGACGFFLRLRESLLKATLLYLQSQLKSKKIPQNLREKYSNIMDGIQAYVEPTETSSSESRG